jgi:hypothetical protein
MKLHATSTEARDGIEWESAITPEEARKALELKFYKSAEIDWIPLEKAVVEAETAQRPIHTVLTWGPLDDESC